MIKPWIETFKEYRSDEWYVIFKITHEGKQFAGHLKTKQILIDYPFTGITMEVLNKCKIYY